MHGSETTYRGSLTCVTDVTDADAALRNSGESWASHECYFGAYIESLAFPASWSPKEWNNFNHFNHDEEVF
jgi:hypothetical protein